MFLIDKAIYGLIHDYPGGAAAVASLSKMNPGTLSNKANPEMKNHHLTVNEAVIIQQATQDFRILKAEAAALNHAAIPLGNFKGVSDVELLSAYANYHADIGKTSITVSEAMNDARITREEFDAVQDKFFKAAGSGLEFLNRMEALIDD